MGWGWIFLLMSSVALIFGASGIALGISFERWIVRARRHGWDFDAARREMRS